MSVFKQHLDLASERFMMAERLFDEGKEHTASHLYINAAINYHNALCQKYLAKIPSHKSHSDTTYFQDLSGILKGDSKKYAECYKFLVTHKGQADYGIGISQAIATQIRRRAQTFKEMIERLL